MAMVTEVEEEEGLEIVAEAEVYVLGNVEVLVVRFAVAITTMLSIVTVVTVIFFCICSSY